MKILKTPGDVTGRTTQPTYVDEAGRGEYRWWRYLLGLVVILVLYLVVGTAASLALVYAFTGGLVVSALSPPAGFVVTMAGFPFFVAGIVLTVTRIHRRPLRTLVTARERIDWRRVGHGFVVWFVLWCLAQGGQFALSPGTFSMGDDLAALALFVPLALVLTAIQTTTEELFFRGYVVQAASRVWGNRVFVALVSAVAFTSVHLGNPEAGTGGWLTVFFGYFLCTGVVWVVVSLIDGTTELAIGAHFANNIATILLVGTAGTAVSTPALFTVAEFDPIMSALSSLVIATLFLVICVRFLKRDTTHEVETR
ncbi:type II CAAX endopeptidase family protein [Pseudonocardia tropica]|uniref:Type II CAAX endopeptidase family protein n=1 Tax=Pseudonocardia tropica TaxID=681289 RepID=A0ABV1JZG8_9PSEU